MKKILTLITVLFFSLMTFNSCEEPIPDCERYSYGDITIENQTGFSMYFALDDYSEFRLSDNGSKTYYDESAGTHYFYYYNDFYEQWYYDTEYLSSCKHLTFTWSLNKKKSTDREITLEIYENGKLINTLRDFNIDIKRDKLVH